MPILQMRKKRHHHPEKRRLVQMDRRNMQRSKLHLCHVRQTATTAERDLRRIHKKKNRGQTTRRNHQHDGEASGKNTAKGRGERTLLDKVRNRKRSAKATFWEATSSSYSFSFCRNPLDNRWLHFLQNPVATDYALYVSAAHLQLFRRHFGSATHTFVDDSARGDFHQDSSFLQRKNILLLNFSSHNKTVHKDGQIWQNG